MTHRILRSALSEFWLLASLSVLIIGGLVLLLWAPWNRRGIDSNRPLVFYCAAGMHKPVEEIVADYKREYGVQVLVNFEGSGQLLSKIRTGATADLFLSADQFHMDKARKEGLVAEVIPVAVWQPVLIVKSSTQEKLTQQGKPITGLKDLLRPELKVALADPKLAAIGKLVKDALSNPSIGIWPKLEKELDLGSNRVSTVGTVNQVIMDVRAGEGVIGIVWKALAQETSGVVMIAPPELEKCRELIQVGVVTSAKGEQATAALQFARYLTAKDKGLVRFAAHQFEIIADADVWAERPEIHLSAGAMLRPGIENVVKLFEKREGVKIDTTFAGCGLLVAQMKGIKQGEKTGNFPDAYFACDTTFLDKVQQWFDAGVIVSANDMVLLVKKGNPKNITELKDLEKGDLNIGLGDPEKCALGKLTLDLLNKTIQADKVYGPAWRKNGSVIFSEAGHDLVNKIRVGALDVAIAYRSNAKSNPDNQQYMNIIDLNIPEALARQPYAIAKDSPHKYLMKRLLADILAQHTAEHFQSIGFRWVYDGK